jgi:hypothetical protein
LRPRARFHAVCATGDTATVLVRTFIVVAALSIVSAAAAASGSLPGMQTKSDRAAWRKLLHWPAGCEASWREGGSGAGVAGVWPLAHGGFLVAVDCSLGAYQGTSMLYLLDSNRRASGPVALHIYQDQGAGVPGPTTTTLVLGTLLFSPPSRTLAVGDLGRGAGDCGIYSTFKLIDTRLVPIATRAKACDSKPPYDVRRSPKLALLTTTRTTSSIDAG